MAMAAEPPRPPGGDGSLDPGRDSLDPSGPGGGGGGDGGGGGGGAPGGGDGLSDAHGRCLRCRQPYGYCRCRDRHGRST
eukprot:4604416-Heterocapsa_arctica.AAC.1